MDAVGALLRTLAEGVAGLFGVGVRAFEAAVQAVFGNLQAFLPGLWLPIVGFVVLVVVAWNLARR